MSVFGYSYFSDARGNRWVRLFGFQFGWHRNGRFRLFSERNGYRKGPLTLKVGRTAEMSFCRVRRLQ